MIYDNECVAMTTTTVLNEGSMYVRYSPAAAKAIAAKSNKCTARRNYSKGGR